MGRLISEKYKEQEKECRERFDKMKKNEEELNRIFIDVYGLNDELKPEEDDKDVTVRLANEEREIKSLISYAVGCMMGRYSLDEDGLVFAGGTFDINKYHKYIPDDDGIIPIFEIESVMTDDIVNKFIDFIKVVYGEDTLDENLKYIAKVLSKGSNGDYKDIIRKYFVSDFYADHLKTYQKKPIYWLFDSGKKNGCKFLVYLHRYHIDNVDYLMHVADLQGVGATNEISLAELISLFSSGIKRPLLSSIVVLGSITIAGTINKVSNLADVLQICLDSGAKKVLLPASSASDLGIVPSELASKFSLLFYATPEDAVFKALGTE